MTPALPGLNFTWRPTLDASQVLAIHRSVLVRCPPGMVRPDPISHFEHHMGPGGKTLGCFLDNGDMVAYGVLGLESPTVEHLARLLSADASRFCVLDGASALSEWRGFGLHFSSIEERIRFAATLDRTLVAATVAPENIRSVRGLFRAGLEIRGFAVMYGDLPRLLVQRDMLLAISPRQRELSVPLADHAGHRAALAAGLCGYACSQAESGIWMIDYGR